MYKTAMIGGDWRILKNGKVMWNLPCFPTQDEAEVYIDDLGR